MRTRKKKIIPLILGFLAIIASFFWLLTPQKIEAAWFDDSYSYRKRIEFGNTGSADSDKKVKFDIDTATFITAGQMQSDCDDTRFTDINGKLLKYYLDSTGGACNTSSTDYYVLVPTINSGSTVVYIYYGNASVASGSQASQLSQSTFTPTSGPTLASEEKGTTPVLYWKFDEGTGTTANDTTSNSNSGTFKASGEPVIQTEALCLIGKCLSFDGTNDYVRRVYSSDTELNFGTSSFTVSAWFKHPTSISGTDVLIARSNNAINGIGYKIYMNSSGFMCFGIDEDATTFPGDSACGTTSRADNQWHFVEAVKNGTSNIQLYIDGNLITQTTITTAADGSLSGTSANFVVGNDGDSGTTNPWVGFIDEVKVYNYAKTAAQIKTDFSSRGNQDQTGSALGYNAAKDTLATGLAGYWKMDESTANGCTVVGADNCDSSGNGNDGTWSGGTTSTTGKFSNAITLDGADDYVDMGDPSSGILDPGTESFSYSLWVSSASSVGCCDMPIFKGGSSVGTAGYDMELGTANWYANISDGTTSKQLSLSSSGQSTFGTNWTLLTAVIDRNANQFNGYINGVLVNSTDITGLGSLSNASTLRLGTDNSSANDYSGKVDDVRIYNRALSATEVSSLYDWAPGPVGYWNFDEKTGTTANDSSGNANTATLTNSPSWGLGKYGSAVSFTASNHLVNAGSGSSLDDISVKTLEAWVYLNGTVAQDQKIFQKEGTGWFIFHISASTRQVYFEQQFNTTSGSWYTTNNVIPLTTWTHVAVTYDRTSTSNVPTIYINGIPQALTTNTTPSGTPQTEASGDLYIGNGLSANRYFNGLIDEARVYNYARTPKQIVSDMNGGHPSVGSPVGSATAYWNFNEGYGTTANDISPNSNSLTLSSASWSNNGMFGKGWNGTGSVWLTRADDDDFDFAASDDFTISTWFKSDSATNPASNAEFLISKGTITNTGTAGYAIYAKTDGTVVFGVKDDAAWGGSSPNTVVPDDTVTSSNDVYDGMWHNIVVTKKGTNRMDMYIDGKPNGTPDTSIAATATLANSIALRVADDDADSANSFNGDLDDMKVYRYALSAEEARVEYNQGKAIALGTISTDADGTTATSSASRSYCVPGDTTTCNAPVAEWRFDEHTGTSTYDTSGNGSTGTLTGATTPTWKNGKIGTGLDFSVCNSDGSINCRVTVSAATSINNIFASGGTVELWMKPTTNGISGDGRIIDKRTSTPSLGWSIITQSDTSTTVKLLFVHDTSGTSGQYTITGVTKSAWSHISIQFNKTSFNAAPTTYKPTIYLNGIAQTVTIVGTPSGTASDDSGQGITVGNSTGTGRNFDGIIDNIVLYSYARTAAQVAWSYNRGGPIGWWKLDECSGTTAYDSSGNGYNGTIDPSTTGNTAVGTCSSGTSTHMWDDGTIGKFNASLGFDGTNDRLDVGQIVTPTNNYSFSAWVKTTASTTQQILSRDVGGAASSARQFQFRQETTGVLTLIRFDSSGNVVANFSTTRTINDGSWHHVVATFSDSVGSVLYLDGNSAATNSTLTANGNAVGTGASTVIGGRYNGSSPYLDFFNGQIDDVRMYGYALTSTQIKTLYNNNAAVRFAPDTGQP